MTTVRLEQLTKTYGPVIALDAINLQINAGELFCLLGPSGCGKSTLLRLIAGLNDPTSGKIFFNDRNVTQLPTQHRNAVMCFQSYALWPHMTVRQNIRFGLDTHNSPRTQSDQRVQEVLSLVQLTAQAHRHPAELSGGQQQRVALARALAPQPDCLLLDEPLSNLDAKLRVEMRTEIHRICKSAGATTIYVTHDQKEALAISDRLAVMKDGKIIQVGTPAEVYESPQSSFVASFIGQTNLIPAEVIAQHDSTVELQTPIGKLSAALPSTPQPKSVILSLRPEHFQFTTDNTNQPNQLTGQPVETTYLGESSEHVIAVNDHRLRVISIPPRRNLSGPLMLTIHPRDVVMMSS